MATKPVNIEITQGDTFFLPVRFKNNAGESVDLAGSTFVAVVRDMQRNIAYPFEIKPGAAPNEIILFMDESQTAQLRADYFSFDTSIDYGNPPENYIWGLKHTVNDDTRTVLSGSVKVNKAVF